MLSKNFKYFGLLCIWLGISITKSAAEVNGGRRTRFTCHGRAAGYYADIDTGCQVYHMCDGLGRQFSYSCPNTTLFQQRMLICDHWYMVNCSRAQSDYSANLLIGQRDKPFVSEAEMQQLRTPRPDILSVPPNNNYYDGLREAETKFPVHPGNSIVGVPDTILSGDNNGLDSAKKPYRPPTSWSMGTGSQSAEHTSQVSNTHRDSDDSTGSDRPEHDNLAGAASQDPSPTFRPISTTTAKVLHTSNAARPPSTELVPPIIPRSTTTENAQSEEFQIDVRMKSNHPDPVVDFIKRFDPNSPDTQSTSMTTSEIVSINRQLPTSHDLSIEDERTPRRHKNVGNHFNTLQGGKNKNVGETPRFETVNQKPTVQTFERSNLNNFENSPSTVKTPNRELVPPKTNYSDQPITTMGPPVYYEWKWAVPAFDLEPPKESNITQNRSSIGRALQESQKSPFSHVTRPPPKEIDVVPANTEYNTSSYFIPDFVFPLEKSHPGYENEDAQTSFQVKIARSGKASYGENPTCPHCHPAYLNPGTCEPCIVKR